MPEQDIVTSDATVTPSAAPADAAQTAPTEPQVNPQLEARLNELVAKMDTLSSSLAAKDEVIAGYKAALGNVVQQRQAAPATSDLASKYDAEVVQLIDSRAEKLFNQNLSKLMVQGQAQQIIGTDQEIGKATEREYQALKTNPYYAGQSDEMLYAFAAANAKANVNTTRLDAMRNSQAKQAEKDALAAQVGAGRIPGATPSNKPTDTDPDADIREYMSDPGTIKAMTKLLGVDATSDTEISWRGGKRVPAKEAFKDLAIRAVRTGVSVSERMRMGAGVPIGQREA